MLLIGRNPTLRSLFAIASSEGTILTSLTAAAIYLGHNSGISTLTEILSSTLSSQHLKPISGMRKGLPSTADTSRAMPSTLLQSLRFAVTPMSRMMSSLPSTSLMSVPRGAVSLFITRMPYTPAPL